MKNNFTILIIFLLSFQFGNSQTIASDKSVTTHQYRRVEPENMEEYLRRETTYWSKLAESEMSKGNLTYWAILQKVGGENMLNAPNILIINTFKDLDTEGIIWENVLKLFPDLKMKDVETNKISKVTDYIYLRNINRIEAKNIDPERDFKYMFIVYHHTKNVGDHFKFENEVWAPIVQKAMDQGITTMKAWGNDIIVAPQSINFPYASVSYDVYPSMHTALSETFSDLMEFPEGFFDSLNSNYAGPKNTHLYRVVQQVRASEGVEEEDEEEEEE